MTKQTALSAAKIDDARKKINPVFLNTDILHSDRFALSLFAKDETETPIRSFKRRGTGYFVADAADDGSAPVTASAGNFRQGLAIMPRGMGDL